MPTATADQLEYALRAAFPGLRWESDGRCVTAYMKRKDGWIWPVAYVQWSIAYEGWQLRPWNHGGPSWCVAEGDAPTVIAAFRTAIAKERQHIRVGTALVDALSEDAQTFPTKAPRKKNKPGDCDVCGQGFGCMCP